MSDSFCRTTTLDDSPVVRDEFGSAHARTAAALCRAILTESGGRAIGLVGEWGSGKSSIVSMAKEQATKEDSDCRFVVFDAWSHEGDFLRKAFVEFVLASVADWIPGSRGEHYEKQRLGLRGQRITTKRSTTSGLTRSGWLLAATVLFVPFGVGVYTTLDGLPEWFQAQSDWWGFAAGSVLSLLPAIVLGALFLVASLSEKARNWLEERLHKLGSAGALLGGSQDFTDEREVSDSAELSSITFQEMFAALMVDVLVERRKLVLVVDNLDRVTPAEMERIWATMSAFFEAGNLQDGKRADWLARFWLVVPFADATVAGLWSAEGTNDNRVSYPIPVGTQGRLREEMVSKRLNLVFRVPPPTLSDWKKYMRGQLSLAFPDHNPAAFPAIVEIYRLMLCADRPPTPRQVKRFINGMGSLHRVWGDSIDLEVQADYVAHSLCEQDLRFPITVSAQEAALLLNDHTESDLAALHYQIEPDQVMHVLVEPRLRIAIENADPAAFQEAVQVPGGWAVAESVLTNNVGTWSGTPEIFSKFGLCVDAATNGTSEKQTLMAMLVQQVMRAGPCASLDSATGIGWATLVMNAAKPATVLDRILESLSSFSFS